MNPDTSDPSAFDLSGLPQTTLEADRNGSGLDNQGKAVDTEELGCDFVPPKKTVRVSLRYCIRGRGKPLPYPLDEEDGQ